MMVAYVEEFLLPLLPPLLVLQADNQAIRFPHVQLYGGVGVISFNADIILSKVIPEVVHTTNVCSGPVPF
jgi:hypothetical protein